MSNLRKVTFCLQLQAEEIVNNAQRMRGRLKCFPFAIPAQNGTPRHRAALCCLTGKHLKVAAALLLLLEPRAAPRESRGAAYAQEYRM